MAGNNTTGGGDACYLIRVRGKADAFIASAIIKHDSHVEATGQWRHATQGFTYGDAASYSWPWREVREIREYAA
jgi:hypothetical protein